MPAEQINDFLGKLLTLVVQNRISVRRAAVLACINNQLLRTVSIMKKENEDNPQIIFDMPAPSATACRRQSLRTPMCAPDPSGTAFLGCPP